MLPGFAGRVSTANSYSEVCWMTKQEENFRSHLKTGTHRGNITWKIQMFSVPRSLRQVDVTVLRILHRGFTSLDGISNRQCLSGRSNHWMELRVFVSRAGPLPTMAVQHTNGTAAAIILNTGMEKTNCA